MEYVRSVINGYELVKTSAYRGDGSKNLAIAYLTNGEYYAGSQFEGISNAKVRAIRNQLDECVTYNLKINDVSQAISFITILHLINSIAFE